MVYICAKCVSGGGATNHYYKIAGVNFIQDIVDILFAALSIIITIYERPFRATRDPYGRKNVQHIFLNERRKVLSAKCW